MGDISTNIILVGMPGSGKSTVGVILAKRLSRHFVDTDILIQAAQGRSLQDVVDKDGYMALRDIEESILLQLRCEDHVIATGGSAVYSRAAMNHLASMGTVIFLETDLRTLEKRLNDFDARGLAKRPDQTLADLFKEREILYKKYAQYTINCGPLNQEDVASEIMSIFMRQVPPGPSWKAY